MELVFLDYLIIVLYFAISLGIGLYSPAGGEFLEEYIVSGARYLWMGNLDGCHTSPRTALAVTGLVIDKGIAATGCGGAWRSGRY